MALDSKRTDEDLRKALKELQTKLYAENLNPDNYQDYFSGIEAMAPEEVEPYFVIDKNKNWCVTNRKASIIPYRYDYYISFGWSTCHLLWLREDGFYDFCGTGMDDVRSWSNHSFFKDMHKALTKDREYVYVDSLPTFISRQGNYFGWNRKIQNMSGPSMEKDMAIEFLKKQGYTDEQAL